MKGIQVIGHRGACAYAPENTMASFQLAVRMGVYSIETDIRTTSDGMLVLCHDPSLERISNGTGRVDMHTYDALTKLDFGSWFSGEFAGERIVTLDQLLDMFGKKIHLTLEIKSDGIADDVIKTLNNYSLTQKEYTITSFNLDYLLPIKRYAPEAETGYLVKEINERSIDRCIEHGITQICPQANSIDSHAVMKAHDSKLKVRAWGVKGVSLMEHAVICGVDGMTIDYPDRLIDYLARRSS